MIILKRKKIIIAKVITTIFKLELSKVLPYNSSYDDINVLLI